MKHFYSYLLFLFTISSFAQPTNETCATSENILVELTSNSYTFDINSAALINEEGCPGSTTDYADVWFDFSMPVDGNVYIEGSINWNNFALYDSCGGSLIQCGFGNQFYNNLSASTNYKLRVFRPSSTASNTGFQSFSIVAFEQTTNDTCTNAENITVTTTQSTVNFDIGGSDINNEEGCSGTTNDYVDIWYDFTMPFNGNLFVDASINWNNIALYDACSGTEINCGNTNLFTQNLVTGTSYKLRIFRTVANADNSFNSFSIRAFEEATNDDCVNAENLTVTTSATTVNFNIGGADINNQEGCSGTTNDYVDIWYDFTMPFNGNLFVDASINWNNIALYDTCNGTEIDCGNTNLFAQNLVASTNYKLRIFRTVANADNSFNSFTIRAFEEAANDNCVNAENLTVSTSTSTVDFNIGGADINNEEGCTGITNDYVDIWYDFTMPVNGNLQISGAINWNNFALYDSCSGTEINCGNTNLLTENLTANTTYKLRVFRTVANADNSFTSFTIQAFEIINNDDCASAETINVSSTETTVFFGIGGANLNNEIGCDGTTAEDYADVWYEFTMPEDGDVAVNGNIAWNNFALYDACNGNQLDCFSASGTFTGLSNGTTYKLRLFRTAATAPNDSFKSFSIVINNTLNTQDFGTESISVYPNPASSTVFINTNETINKLQLFNLQGQKIIEVDNRDNMDVSFLKSGMYILNIFVQDSRISKRVIIN
ncbi:putative secreted protein (Por secretion system target) [Winogradskyella wandonensis]|uniref:Putative secreted protein (Por secretion system target) n=1 Tax=Winogradskyella wandonensis TaxID=1442586 RepID=A0A4V2PT42_9FLAO|nr:T9SS type A sorting domain-containing protein [Winogradskyella wandonensis]TCK65081.1 putative secreted protein (Por secretion system target) [Winogradskyella wandonensis]